MTSTELRIQFKRETGERPMQNTMGNQFRTQDDDNKSVVEEYTDEYAQWLEEKLLETIVENKYLQVNNLIMADKY
jgi:hypothetical protein